MKQYPYNLQVLLIEESQQDSDGNIIPGSETWADYTSCRDEDGAGKKITLANGIDYAFSVLIQMPKGVNPLSSDTTVRVVDGAFVRCSGKVIYSRKDQFHSRAWL